MGGNARTGMEDTLLVRRGVPAASNAELVTRLVGVAASLERDPADSGEARNALSLRA
jgi:3-keto-5-aminohexanoate cleavage enzyme